MRAHRNLPVLLVVTLIAAPFCCMETAHGLRSDTVGPVDVEPTSTSKMQGKTMTHPTEDVEPLLLSPDRMYSIDVNGNNYYYYDCDVKGINELLELFGNVESEPRDLVIVADDTTHHTDYGTFRRTVSLHVPGGFYLGEAIRNPESGFRTTPELTIHVDRPLAEELHKLFIPENVVLHERIEEDTDLQQENLIKEAVSAFFVKRGGAEDVVEDDGSDLAKLKALYVAGEITPFRYAEGKLLLSGQMEGSRAALYAEVLAGKRSPGELDREELHTDLTAQDLVVAASDHDKNVTLDLADGVQMKFILIPSGEFMMGSPESEEDREETEGPLHRVGIAKPFYMGVHEVTQDEWKAVMGYNPSLQKGARLPVESVSWHHCEKFCDTLTRKLGRTVRLPSEAEWEYACRAGTTTPYFFGDQPIQLFKYGWPRLGQVSRLKEAASKLPNSWGLYGTSGNVWEWCDDVWHGDYEGAPSDGSAWRTGGEPKKRVIRGGANSGGFFPPCNRSAWRMARPVEEWGSGNWPIGLRVVVEID